MIVSLSGCSAEETDRAVTFINLSDQEIFVNGEDISQNKKDAVYAGNKIIYYREGQGETYGNGNEKDAHSPEEAEQHTVITITKPGTYEVTGSISKGQIFIDLGEDAEDNPDAKVNLILNNAEITCTVAPSIIVYSTYECG